MINGFIGLPYSDVADYVDTSGQTQQNTAVTTYLYNAQPDLRRYFALAVSRASSGGLYGGTLTFGGLPDTTDPRINVTCEDPTLPSIVKVVDVPGSYYVSWSIYADSWIVDGDTGILEDDQGTGLIVDSGDPWCRVPENVQQYVWSLYSVPVNGDGTIDCGAQFLGSFSVTLSGRRYYISPEDMIVHGASGTCNPAILKTTGVSTLGLPFLRNVLAVFDHDNSQIE